MSLLFAFIPGSLGNKGNNFWKDLLQADWINVISSFAAGIIFNLANILFVAALTIAGMLVNIHFRNWSGISNWHIDKLFGSSHWK